MREGIVTRRAEELNSLQILGVLGGLTGRIWCLKLSCDALYPGPFRTGKTKKRYVYKREAF